jgi:CBS domain containing-hemolysin-like protein
LIAKTIQRCRSAAASKQPLADRAGIKRSAQRGARLCSISIAALLCLVSAPEAKASLFSGDTLDAVADVLAWIVLVIAPVIAITVFWLVHIMPEKIAEKRRHPQAAAIKTLCLLSLFFGGLLWPLAWLWAYSKPVLHKIAYGTDVAPEHEHEHESSQSASEPVSTPPSELHIEETSSEEITQSASLDAPRVQRTMLHRTRVDKH